MTTTPAGKCRRKEWTVNSRQQNNTQSSTVWNYSLVSSSSSLSSSSLTHYFQLRAVS